jgi:hypothetical protein
MMMFKRNTEPVVTDEEPSLTRREFESMQCVHCGGAHLRACPRVRRIVFSQTSSIQEVEFWADGEWDTSNVIWPEEIEEEE